ncbi:MAG: hypothetical protein ABI036_04450, partial [Fibrobacteria bacterium]
INRIKAAIVPALSNNTNYRDPLDTAKKWLLTPTLAPNPSKAIIFLSDGQPTWPTNNPNGYLDVLSATYPQMPGAMPPVYGIFMGKPSADTAKLSDLSKRTGGIFFLIPPSRPDSLKAVVEKILNVILRQYQPNSALVTNSSVAPTQMGRAGAGDFARQADGHWLMSLDKPVGLKAQGDNAINLKTALIDLNSGALKSDTTDFILNTTGPDASTNANLPGTQFGVACVDLPPPINPVKAAYIKDANGDGAADIVFFVFTRPLAALPASIDSVYWNQLGPQFANKIKPALSFLIASGNTVVIADFSATQFPWPQGVTSIPTGAQPVGVLPAGGVFLSQRPLIQDSIGPILIKATIKPFDNSKVVSASDLNVDTIIVTTSEGMLTATDWNKLLVWSKSQNNVCSDYQNALPLVPKGQPDIDASSSTFIFLVPTGTGTPTPLAKDCVYLNVAGSYTDMKHNIPPIYGIPLEGKDPPRRIELFRGYPPVVGITADKPGFVVVTNDPRKGDANDYSTSNGAGSYTTTWIPPYGFSENQTFNPDIPALNAAPVGIEIAGLSVLPPGISTVQVVSNSKYIVDVNIYDNNGNFVRKLRQAFGYHGELNNSNRISLSKHGMVSYLVWDLKDESGQKAGQGAYIWKASFQFDGGKQEIQYTRTGVVRRPDWRTAK